MSELTQNTPNPGSDAAVARGCRCPVMDNARGRDTGNGVFWISEACPLHAVGLKAKVDAILKAEAEADE